MKSWIEMFRLELYWMDEASLYPAAVTALEAVQMRIPRF